MNQCDLKTIARILGEIPPTIEDLENLEDEIREAWKKLHHNASISRHWPDFENDKECEMFWSCLGDHVSMCIDDLETRVSEDFGFYLDFFQYGRQGATIAPSKWMNPAPCSSFGSFNDEILCDWQKDDLDSMEEAWEYDNRVLKTLQFVNEFWASEAKYISEWWKETKEANGYQKDIDEYKKV